MKEAGAAGKILVIGESGQLAMDLKALLGSRAVTFGRSNHAFDLTKPEDVRRLMSSSIAEDAVAVVNAAAYTAVDKAETEREQAFLLNAGMPGAFARACADKGIPFLHFSTDYVFDGRASSPWTEDAPTSPLSAYGESKLAGETAIAAATAERGGRAYVFRTTWVYGEHGHNFLKTMLRLAKERTELKVVADQVGAPTSSLALAQATVSALRTVLGEAGAKEVVERGGSRPGNIPTPGIYHLSAAGETTWHGFASRIVERLRTRERIPCEKVTAISTAEYPLPARRPAYSVLSCGKFRAAFGFSLPPWEEQLEEIFGRMGLSQDGADQRSR